VVHLLLSLTVAGLISSEPALSSQRAPAGSPEVSEPITSGQGVSGSRSDEELVVTLNTEVLLDGRPCKYEQIPEDAAIIFAEVDQDRKTLLKIHFRSAKKERRGR
jgi:hypothetical protein